MIERVPPSEWPRLGPFIFRHNRSDDGRVRCLHGDQGDHEASHVDELAALPADSAAFWRIAGENGDVLGVVGCEIDDREGRAWIRGPWTVAGEQAAVMARTLLHALESSLPQVRRIDAFPSEHDAALNALFLAQGYQRMDVHRVMQAPLRDLPRAIEAPDRRIMPAVPSDLTHWLPLHRQLFPGTYLTDADIEEALGGSGRLVLTAHVHGRPMGYLVAKNDAPMDELYIDYIGVDPACRGQGVGRALMLEAMRWGRDLGRSRAALTVRQDREDALSLYRHCGFSQVSAGVHWRKDRSPQDAASLAQHG